MDPQHLQDVSYKSGYEDYLLYKHVLFSKFFLNLYLSMTLLLLQYPNTVAPLQ